jgi:hypothetical protein
MYRLVQRPQRQQMLASPVRVGEASREDAMSHTEESSVTPPADQDATTSELVEIVTNPAGSVEFVTYEQLRAYEDARDSVVDARLHAELHPETICVL